MQIGPSFVCVCWRGGGVWGGEIYQTSNAQQLVNFGNPGAAFINPTNA